MSAGQGRPSLRQLEDHAHRTGGYTNLTTMADAGCPRDRCMMKRPSGSSSAVSRVPGKAGIRTACGFGTGSKTIRCDKYTVRRKWNIWIPFVCYREAGNMAQKRCLGSWSLLELLVGVMMCLAVLLDPRPIKNDCQQGDPTSMKSLGTSAVTCVLSYRPMDSSVWV
ncbi:hypothetical protein BC826DRAFT_1179396 [Russula brevipes]|nr:hypothetical protein BC826DRAFT_1179396 [Russula brevipes]